MSVLGLRRGRSPSSARGKFICPRFPHENELRVYDYNARLLGPDKVAAGRKVLESSSIPKAISMVGDTIYVSRRSSSGCIRFLYRVTTSGRYNHRFNNPIFLNDVLRLARNGSPLVPRVQHGGARKHLFRCPDGNPHLSFVAYPIFQDNVDLRFPLFPRGILLCSAGLVGLCL